MATICGNCGKLHAGVSQVKACYGGADVAEAAEKFDATAVPKGFFPDGKGAGRRKGPIEIPEGIYEKQGVRYKVRISGRSGLPYASIRRGGKWEYAPGAIRTLKAKHRTGDLPSEDQGKPKPAGKKKTAGAAAQQRDSGHGPVIGSSRAARANYDDMPEPESGMYEHPGSGEILKVYKAVHGSGKMCAKRLVIIEEPVRDASGEITEPAQIEWKYLGLAVKYLNEHEKVPLDRAAEWGRIYGCCMRCGAVLTLEQSIEAGLGTTCITYFAAA